MILAFWRVWASFWRDCPSIRPLGYFLMIRSKLCNSWQEYHDCDVCFPYYFTSRGTCSQFVLLLHRQNPVGSLGKGRRDLGDKIESNLFFGVSLVSLACGGLCATEVLHPAHQIRVPSAQTAIPDTWIWWAGCSSTVQDTSSQDGKAGSVQRRCA